MGALFTSDVVLLPTAESIELPTIASTSSVLDQFVGNSDAYADVVHNLLDQSVQMEMYPYLNIGRPVARTKYHIEIFDVDDRLKYSDDFFNLVTTEGLNNMLDATFKTGVSSPTWFIGLVSGAGTPTYATGNTAASHSSWTEFAAYSDGTRQAFTPGTISAGAVDNVSNRAVFHINGTGSVAGCFSINDSTISGTSGVLHGVGTFVAGARDVQDGDILRISTTISVDAG